MLDVVFDKISNWRLCHAEARNMAYQAAEVQSVTSSRKALESLTEGEHFADKGYAQEFIEACKLMKLTPHVAQNTARRRSCVPDMIAASVGYAISQQSAS
ncbi:hypothetical protein [Paraburkholderia humisilvae]|nr:hypothetical protein [Paraburkholderia humisilvae]